MRVGMLLRGRYPPDIRVRKEAAALRAAGHEVRLLCLADEDDGSDTVDGVPVTRFRWGEAPLPVRAVDRASYLGLSFSPRWYVRARRFVARERVDALHVHDLPLVRTALAVAARRPDGAGTAEGLPVVADLHEHYPAAVRQYRAEATRLERVVATVARPVGRIERAEREAVTRADATLAVVPEARDHYCEIGADPERVHVISNTVDLDRLDELDADPPDGGLDDVPDDAFVVGYVGSFGPHRGLGTLLRAVARLSNPSVAPAMDRPVELLLVGAGSDRFERRLRDHAAALGIADRVTFTGWVDFDDVPGYVRACDLAAVPHERTAHTATTVPHKLFQYMALRRPVLVTDVGPLGRIVREADAGVVAPPGEPLAMARAVREVAADPESAARMGAAGRQAVEGTYNWSRDAARLQAVYADLAD